MRKKKNHKIFQKLMRQAQKIKKQINFAELMTSALNILTLKNQQTQVMLIFKNSEGNL